MIKIRGFCQIRPRTAHPQISGVECHVFPSRPSSLKGNFCELEDVARSRSASGVAKSLADAIQVTIDECPGGLRGEEKSHGFRSQAERFETTSWAQFQVHPGSQRPLWSALFFSPTRWIGWTRGCQRRSIVGEPLCARRVDKDSWRKRLAGRLDRLTLFGGCSYAWLGPHILQRAGTRTGAGDFTISAERGVHLDVCARTESDALAERWRRSYGLGCRRVSIHARFRLWSLAREMAAVPPSV